MNEQSWVKPWTATTQVKLSYIALGLIQLVGLFSMAKMRLGLGTVFFHQRQ